AVPRFRVGYAVPLVRRGPEGFGEEDDFWGAYAQFAALRPDDFSRRADDVADVELVEGFDAFGGDEELDLARRVLDVTEADLAHDAPRDEPSRDGRLLAGVFALVERLELGL